MVKTILQNDHITFASANDISAICKPLEKLGITSFNYVRTYDDGSQINLSNTPLWLEHFYQNEFFKIGAFEKHPCQYVSGYSLWPQLSGQRIFYDARVHYNIDHGITIIEKQVDSCEFYYFGTTANNPGIINWYLNNLDLLKRFILYFKDRSRVIMMDASKNKIILPNHFEKTNPAIIAEHKKMHSLRDEFLQDIPLKYFALNGPLQGEVLTSKQINCFIHLVQGKTAKKVAKQLGISHKTVEGHINNLKMKFSCKSKAELINTLIQSGLGIYIDKCNI